MSGAADAATMPAKAGLKDAVVIVTGGSGIGAAPHAGSVAAARARSALGVLAEVDTGRNG